ncbi:MAG: hypothetical protein SGJ18_13040 [Pseudomonadota bacterium]|nr:hypothetical protein [Pseudomonadota bacterium]
MRKKLDQSWFLGLSRRYDSLASRLVEDTRTSPVLARFGQRDLPNDGDLFPQPFTLAGGVSEDHECGDC